MAAQQHPSPVQGHEPPAIDQPRPGAKSWFSDALVQRREGATLYTGGGAQGGWLRLASVGLRGIVRASG
jgi:hypothetical protein